VKRSIRRVLLLICPFLAIGTVASGQSQISGQVQGVSTNQLQNPGPPTGASNQGCSGTGYTYIYVFVALDAAGGMTKPSSAVTITATCIVGAGPPVAYNTFTTQMVAGSASCIVWRTAGPLSTGKLMGSVLCGSPFYDTGLSVDSTFPTSVPGINSTGALAATGAVTAQNFVATSSTGAGTSDWVQGVALPYCGSPLTNPPPCIQVYSFFLQAPPSIATSFGWTAPSVANAAGPNNAGSTPLIVGPSTLSAGGVQTSALTYGYFTTATIMPGDLATYTGSGTLGNCSNLPCNPIIGVFNSSTTWIDSGETVVNLDGPSVNVNYNDILCASATGPGEAHDNGSVACTTGEWVGVVKASASGVSSATAFITLK
jgi:hypothetical protein